MDTKTLETEDLKNIREFWEKAKEKTGKPFSELCPMNAYRIEDDLIISKDLNDKLKHG